jgi:hypothetical protein
MPRPPLLGAVNSLSLLPLTHQTIVPGNFHSHLVYRIFLKILLRGLVLPLTRFSSLMLFPDLLPCLDVHVENFERLTSLTRLTVAAPGFRVATRQPTPLLIPFSCWLQSLFPPS